jgi:signal transduction histidine kinase
VNTPETIGMFKLFADLIGRQLETHDRLAASEAALLDARETAELREQFIAVLGHDLRNPLASIDAGATMLQKMPLDPKAAAILALMRKSVTRMAGLVDNVLDLARGRLGGGIPVQQTRDAKLGDALAQVVAELRTAWPDRVIETSLVLDRPVTCDSARIAQLFSNLLANALTHGDPARPVRAQARTDADMFELSVGNYGPPIPAVAAARLFQPFTRASARAGEQGLGLGLYIASEIARAHDGSLDFVSVQDETRFTFRMPLRASAAPAAAEGTGAVRREQAG